ncbi:MAG: tryptophan synthase subunit alpha [Rhodospirillaceae bacterium]|jgi:tryptophan synthase alpha chain|nr:tryptophan synthase subunit alpha [Rhodospirillaceae bacterium]MBT5459944.1 tryptophan synthase subunit alpha [Rhodospirillaceae bacterium]
MSRARDRIKRRFEALAEENRAGLVTFVTAGDPDPDISEAIIKGLPAAGADMIELGMPFTDPMADGPAVQLSSLRALRAGQTQRRTLEMVSRFREQDNETPIVLMGYYNPIYIYGVEQFVSDAADAGVDGLIIVDLPPEEDAELRVPAAEAGIDFVRLATPTSDENRLPLLMETASGFVYYVSITGITGTRSAETSNIADAVARIRRFTDLPVAVGFGVKTPEQAAEIARVADAAVVGSAIVQRIVDAPKGAGGNSSNLVESVLGFVRELADGVHRARDDAPKEVTPT